MDLLNNFVRIKDVGVIGRAIKYHGDKFSPRYLCHIKRKDVDLISSSIYIYVSSYYDYNRHIDKDYYSEDYYVVVVDHGLEKVSAVEALVEQV